MLFKPSMSITEHMAIKTRDSEIRRLEEERQRNILRIIAYNNRRIRQGLPLLEIPKALAYPTGWNKPTHRDKIPLTQRREIWEVTEDGLFSQIEDEQ